jgi:hypothetical protein
VGRKDAAAAARLLQYRRRNPVEPPEPRLFWPGIYCQSAAGWLARPPLVFNVPPPPPPLLGG